MNKQQETLKAVKDVARPISTLEVARLLGNTQANVSSMMSQLFRKGCLARAKEGREFMYTYKKCMPKKSKKDKHDLSDQLGSLLLEHKAYKHVLTEIAKLIKGAGL